MTVFDYLCAVAYLIPLGVKMHFWDTTSLATSIARDEITSDDKFLYLIYTNALLVISGYVVWFYAVGSEGFTYWFEGLLLLSVNILGTIKCKKAFATVPDKSLIESFFMLSFPLSIKYYIFTGVSLSVIPWSINYVVASDIFAGTNNPDSIVSALNFIYSFHSLIIILIATSWFYWRMVFHLSNIAEESPNHKMKSAKQ